MRQMDAELQKLLFDLKQLARKPLAQATSMPPGVYTNKNFYRLEEEEIFSKEWLCAGRAESLPTVGDYLTYEIGAQPVFVIRGVDKHLHAFANVCRHRMMRLLEGGGRCTRIVCPYHAWTYDISGQLIHARHMERSKHFDISDIQLPRVRCEIWEGWIFVTLNWKIRSVAKRLAPLQKIVKRYRMSKYVEVAREDHTWNTNWKCLTENFMEGYHLPVAHRATVGAYFPVEATRFDEERKTYGAFTYQTFLKTSKAPVGTADPANKSLRGRWRNTSVLPTIFPSHMMTLAPDHLWYLSLQPQGPDKVRIRYGIAFAPELMAKKRGLAKKISNAKAFLDEVQAEDRVVVEGIFLGAMAPLSRPGALSWLEKENHEFTRYLVKRVAASV